MSTYDLVEPRDFSDGVIYIADDMLGLYKKKLNTYYRKFVDGTGWDVAPMTSGMFLKKFRAVTPDKGFEYKLASEIDGHTITVVVMADDAEQANFFLDGIAGHEYKRKKQTPKMV